MICLAMTVEVTYMNSRLESSGRDDNYAKDLLILHRRFCEMYRNHTMVATHGSGRFVLKADMCLEFVYEAYVH